MWSKSLAHLQNPPPLTNRVVTFGAFGSVKGCIIYYMFSLCVHSWTIRNIYFIEKSETNYFGGKHIKILFLGENKTNLLHIKKKKDFTSETNTFWGEFLPVSALFFHILLWHFLSVSFFLPNIFFLSFFCQMFSFFFILKYFLSFFICNQHFYLFFFNITHPPSKK